MPAGRLMRRVGQLAAPPLAARAFLAEIGPPGLPGPWAFVAAGRSWPPAPRIVAAEPSAGARHLEHLRSIGGRGAEGGRFADPDFALPLPAM